MPSKVPIAVLISGSGTNLQALLDASHDPGFGCRIVGVVSDRSDAYGLTRARNAGIDTTVVEWADYDDREGFTDAIVEASLGLGAEALVLAGFMRILSPSAIERFPDAILNTHPSLLPLFPGAHAIEDTLAGGASTTGVTVHFVDELVDHGPIIAQEPVVVLPGDDVDALRRRIQEAEHRLYPTVVSAFGRGEIAVRDGTVEWMTDTEEAVL
ncbi:MAG: phosphoribosylglycinamide formyltransferase [Armatimonadetes bacterium]|nr:MAG: phosphoribosylglycinamide formyltransferase [Armatimonadota bacterium]